MLLRDVVADFHGSAKLGDDDASTPFLGFGLLEYGVAPVWTHLRTPGTMCAWRQDGLSESHGARRFDDIISVSISVLRVSAGRRADAAPVGAGVHECARVCGPGVRCSVALAR